MRHAQVQCLVYCVMTAAIIKPVYAASAVFRSRSKLHVFAIDHTVKSSDRLSKLRHQIASADQSHLDAILDDLLQHATLYKQTPVIDELIVRYSQYERIAAGKIERDTRIGTMDTIVSIIVESGDQRGRVMLKREAADRDPNLRRLAMQHLDELHSPEKYVSPQDQLKQVVPPVYIVLNQSYTDKPKAVQALAGVLTGGDLNKIKSVLNTLDSTPLLTEKKVSDSLMSLYSRIESLSLSKTEQSGIKIRLISLVGASGNPDTSTFLGKAAKDPDHDVQRVAHDELSLTPHISGKH